MGAHPQDEGRDPGGLYVQVLQGVLARRLYNRWVKERLEFYRRVEPSAPLRDVSVVDQKVPRFRFGRTTQTGHLSDAIWELILRNPEAAALKRIEDIAKGAA